MDEPAIAVQRMRERLEMWQKASDPRATFLYCYVMMTENMLTAIQAGEFNDPVWVRHLLEHFANYYFTALQGYEQQDPGTPAVWRLTFESAHRPGSLVLQNLLLGVNAHINYDLVLALSDLLEPDWYSLDDHTREQRYNDHCHVSQVITRTIDSVQDTILEPQSLPLQLADVLFGPVDEWVISRLIGNWREQVWEQAMQRISSPDPEKREELRRAVETGCLKLSERILLRG